MEDPEARNNTNDPTNETVEANFEGGTYFFSSAQDPSENTLVYGSTDRFALAMFNSLTAMDGRDRPLFNELLR